MHTTKREIKRILIDKLQTLQSFSEEEVKSIVESILLAEMAKEASHGLLLFNRLKNNCSPTNEGNKFVYIKETDTFAVADCGFISGFHSAELCMQKAIDIAKERGMYAVFARNANTYGAAFVYTLQAVRQGLIGITMANTPAQMTVYGGAKKMLGTNPISYAIPAKNELPIIFDMACSAAAKSRINEAFNKGEHIPEGWGTDKKGQATINPKEVLEGGYVLPFANNAKGFGIAMMVDIFAGLLSGAAYLDEVGYFNSGKMNVGQIFIAIDPTKVYGEGFYEKVDDYIRRVKASGDNVRMPGENKLNNIRKAEEEGFEIEDKLYEALSIK